jgi:Enoyl-(Acyl carrier protein) reductase
MGRQTSPDGRPQIADPRRLFPWTRCGCRRRARRARGQSQRHQPRRCGPGRIRHLRLRLGCQTGRRVRVAEEELGGYYAQRTLLKREVLPEHCVNAVFVLCSDDPSHTTGLHIPVDAGVAAAFLR